MYPIRVLSFNNGWKNLTEQKPEEWKNIQEALLEFDFNMRAQIAALRKMSTSLTASLAVHLLSSVWDLCIRKQGWSDIQRIYKYQKDESLILKNVKNNTSARTIGANVFGADDLSKNLFIDGPRASLLGLCDLHILLLPVDSIRDIFLEESPDDFNPAQFAAESYFRAQLQDNPQNNIDIACVLIFYSQYPEDILVDEVLTSNSEIKSVERILEFPPEFYQAGVSALSYFGQVLRQKYPDITANVRIEQLPESVRMHILLPSGETKVVERALEKYMMVVKGDAEASDLLEDRFHIASLENKIDSLKAEANSNFRLYQLAIDNNKAQERTYESVINQFKILLSGYDDKYSKQGAHIEQLTSLLEKKEENHTQLQLAYVGYSKNIFDSIVESSTYSEKIILAIRSLEQSIMFSANANQSEIVDAITSIKYKQPTLLSSLLKLAENAGYGVAGNIGFELLKQAAQ